MKLRSSVSLSLLCFLLLTLLGCEVATSVRLAGGPAFSFDGSGRLVSLSVYEPQPGHKIATPLDSKSLVWRIEPASHAPSGALVTGMDIAYYKVPKGYVQKFPGSDTPVPLAGGLVYAFIAETTGAPGANGFFYMEQSGPILINVPGLCQSVFVGDVRPVKCGTSEPYVEPKDLQKFAQENRVR